MLGHELRNPLGILSTAVQLQHRTDIPEEKRLELQNMMERQVAHMTRLLDDLLDVSRIAQGRIRLFKEPCDLAAIVRDSSVDLRQAFESAGVSLSVDVPDHPVWVTGDRTRLAQAVANLLHNAVKFTDPGGRVRVQLGTTGTGDAAELTVTDTGVGMSADVLDRAFEPFNQAGATVERSRGGLGLGLALVKGLIEMHDGHVAAASGGPGRGSRLSFRLPLGQSPGDAPAVGRPQLEAPGRTCRILLVEDNSMAARSLEVFLVSCGHTVEVAATGRAGIEAAERFRPDVVVCDIGLPESDGCDVARALRRHGRTGEVGLIAVTGYGQDDDRRRAEAAGFDRHMTKPVDLDALRRAIAELCERSSPHGTS